MAPLKASPNRHIATSPNLLRRASLRYASDTQPGIARQRRGRGFIYRGPDGRLVRDPRALDRISKLVIPPAWTDVWICPDPKGHLQATGRDVAGRKQYRYHDRWTQFSSQTKYDHVLAFAEVLPDLRRAVDRDMQRPRLDARRVLAGLVRLLDVTLIRVGNDCYTQQNSSYGLTTLRDRHVQFIGNGRAILSFNGKSGQHQELNVADPRLVRLIRKCHDLPGYRLFQYIGDQGEQYSIGSGEVNDYIREATGCDDLSAKDFRTWGGTTGAAVVLSKMDCPESKTRRERIIAAAVKQVAQQLGNRPAACRKYYIHPAVLDAYRARELLEYMNPPTDQRCDPSRPPRKGLSAQERAVKKLLEDRI